MLPKKTRFNFNHLYCFYILTVEGSVIKAAKRLDMTASSVSTNVGVLEYWFGKKLFKKYDDSSEGDRRVNILTDFGLELQEYCINIFEPAHVLLEEHTCAYA